MRLEGCILFRFELWSSTVPFLLLLVFTFKVTICGSNVNPRAALLTTFKTGLKPAINPRPIDRSHTTQHNGNVFINDQLRTIKELPPCLR